MIYISKRILHELPQSEYVYLIRDIEATGLYKIGRTAHPKTRIVDQFGVQFPFEIAVLRLIPTSDANLLERMLHKRYRDKRVKGEWFALSDSDVLEILSVGTSVQLYHEEMLPSNNEPKPYNRLEHDVPSRINIRAELFTTKAAAEYLNMSEIGVKTSPYLKGFLLNPRCRIYLRRELDAYRSDAEYSPDAPFDSADESSTGYEAAIRSNIFNIHQAVDYLQMHRNSIKKAERNGHLDSVKLDTATIYLKEQLDQYRDNPPKIGRPESPRSKYHGVYAKYRKKQDVPA
jgi:hypothetical protein